MATKVFLDTNLLLDYALKKEGYDIAKITMQLVVDGKFKAYITASIINTLGHWLTKGYASMKAKEILLESVNYLSLIETNMNIIIKALESDILDIEDSILYHTAIYHRMDYFITNNKKFIKESLSILPIMSCKDFLTLYSQV